MGLFLLSPQSAFAAGPWKGDAYVSTANAALGNRYFALRTVNDQLTGQNRASWELDAGTNITLFYKTWTTGATPPSAPTNIILRVLSDNGATVVRTLSSGSVPADGASYTFSATSDGTSGGTPKAGMYRLYVEAVCSGVCVPGTYDVTSDANGDKGAVRGGIKVSDITKNAYPAGAQYAYGPAGDETMTFTAASTDRVEDTGTNQTVRVNTRRNAGSVIENGASQELGTSGSTPASFTADTTYDPTTGTNYDTEFEIVGTSNLLAGEKWTHIATTENGASIIRDSATVARYANRFAVDPSISFSTDGTTANNNATTTFSVYNRGETVNWQFYLLNSRLEKLSRAMTVSVIASDNATEDGPASRTPAANLYSASYAVGAAHLAANDTTGSAKRFRAANTDQTKDSNNAHAISSLYFIDAHPQLTSTVSKDDWPTQNANETTSGVIAADFFSFFAHVKNVRKDTNIDTSGSAITFIVKKPDGTTSATQTSDTGTDGWTNNYDFYPVAPAGSWSVVASTTFNGNSATDTETLTFVSPYAGNYLIEHVGWNQTYSLGNTARFTIQTQQRNSSTGAFDAAAADSTPTYTLRYWDGDLSQWIAITSGTMTALSPTGTYETTYLIPSTSAWAGRKVSFSTSAVISGTRINDAREIEIVSSPAQVVINSITDATVPTISASTRITNEGTAAFEYTYEYCVVASDANQCGGGDDVAYGSAAKLIQAGANFDTTLTLNVTQTGNYIFKVAVWWSNQSSKSSKTFTATSEPAAASASSSGGGGSVVQPTPAPADTSGLAAVWQKITEIYARLLGIENRVGDLEARVASLERQLSQRVAASTGRQEIRVPKPPIPHISDMSNTLTMPKIKTPAKPFFKIRLQ